LNALRLFLVAKDNIAHDYIRLASSRRTSVGLKNMDFFEPPSPMIGGACCIEISDPRQPSKMLWLGVVAKTPHALMETQDA
jgi:hypothetical protein